MLSVLSFLYTLGIGHFGPFLTNCFVLYILMSWTRIFLKHFHRLALSWESQESSHLTFYLICFAYNVVSSFAFGEVFTLGDKDAAQALSKLLANVTFHIPDIVLVQDGITMEITNFYCKHIALSDLVIEDKYAVSDTTDTLQVEASGLQIECTGDFDVKRGRFLHITGNVDAVIDESTFGTEIDFLINNEFAPSKATMKDCEVVLNFKKLKFGGNLLVDIVNLFTPLIENAIEKNIQNLACTPIEPLINTNLTQLLQKYDALVDLVGIVPSNAANQLIPTDEILSNGEKVFDFHSVDTIMNALHKILDAQAHNGKLMLNNVVDYMLEDGIISLSPNYTIEIGDDGLSRTNITIETVNVTGLDSLNNLDLLYNISEKYPKVKSNYSLGFAMTLDDLAVHLNGSVTLSPGSLIYHSDGPLTLAAGALMELKDLKLEVLLELPFFENIVKNMNIGDLWHNPLYCIIDMIDLADTNMRLLDVNMGTFTIATNGFAGVAPLFNDLIDAILDLMEPSFNEIIRGAAENILRTFINDKISNMPEMTSFCHGWSPEEQMKKQEMLNEYLIETDNEFLQYVIQPLLNPKTETYFQPIARKNLNVNSIDDAKEIGDVAVELTPYRNIGEESKGQKTMKTHQEYVFGQNQQESDEEKTHHHHHPHGRKNGTKYVNFSDGGFMDLLDFFVDDLLGIKSPISYNIDDLIDTFVNVGYWNKSNVLDQTLTLNLQGLTDVKLKINEIVIDGMDHINVFEILMPKNETELHSTLNLDELKLLLDMEFELQGSGINDGRGTRQHLKFDVELTNFGFHTKTTALLREDDFYNATLDEFVSCPMQLFDELKFHDLELKFDNIFVNLTCVDNVCADGFKELGEVWREQSEALNKAIQKGMDYLFNSKNGVFVYGLNQNLDKMVGKVCDAQDNGKDGFDLERLLYGVGTATVAVLVLVIVLYNMRKCYRKQKYGETTRRRSHSVRSKPAVNSITNSISHYDNLEENGGAVQEDVFWKSENQLMYSPKVPAYMKYGVPIIILCFGHVAFGIANSTPGCGISVKINLAGEVYVLDNVSQMALIETIKGMWNAGVYPLALLIGFLSGLWPHIKFIMMLMCWCLPYPQHERGLAMLWLDALGKWGLIDVYVLVLCMAAFSFYIAPQEVPYLPDDFVSIVVYAVPEIAIFSFIIGMVISLFVTHTITHYHREEVLRKHLQNVEQDYETKEKLQNHAFECFSTEGDKSTARLSHFGIAGVVLIVFLSVALYGYGSYVDSFYFSFEGLIKYVIDDVSVYSFFGVSQRVLKSNNYSAGAWAIYLVFVVFAFAIPVACLVLSLALFLLPLTLRQQKRLFTVVEALFAWASTEVFLVAVIAAMLEVNQYAQFIFAAAQPLNKYLVYILPEDAVYAIFNISTDFKNGCWLLWGAVFAWVLTTQTIIRLAERSIRDRRKLTERLWDSDDHETCCEDSYGFLILSTLKLVSTKKSYRPSRGTTISSISPGDHGFNQDLTGSLV